MPATRPISDLQNKTNEISDLCRESQEPVYITKNGAGDMVVMSIETYERQQAIINLYARLAQAEEEIANGAKGKNFEKAARQLKKDVHGKV